MNGLRTFVLALSVDSINAALRNAQVARVPEITILPFSFVLANTRYTIPHNLGKTPEFVSWLGDSATSIIYASAEDRALWTDTSIVLRSTAVANGILKVEAR